MEYEIAKIIIPATLTLWAVLVAVIAFLVGARNMADVAGASTNVLKNYQHIIYIFLVISILGVVSCALAFLYLFKWGFLYIPMLVSFIVAIIGSIIGVIVMVIITKLRGD